MKRDLYQEVTSAIIEQIEEGARTWRMPWTGHGSGLPFNATTGATYRGINIPILWAKARGVGYETNQWASYRQWLKAGGQVRKGEKGTAIVFYRTIERETAEGEADTIRFLRYYTLFNADQVDDFEPRIVEPACMRARIEACEDFVSNTQAVIEYGHNSAFYSPMADKIGMPSWEAFHDTEHSTATEAAYQTQLHELTHWTGHADRLARDITGRFGSDAYAVEELIAEMGSAFLCAYLGIASEPRRDHAQYIDQWLNVLRSDNKAIFTAAAKASQAVDYLDGLQYAEEPEPSAPAALDHKPTLQLPLFRPVYAA